MFHMLSCFSVRPNVDTKDLKAAMTELSDYMKSHGLLHSIGPLGERRSETAMDTDEERDHKYFFQTTFHNAEQCEAAYKHILSADPLESRPHREMMAMIAPNPVFICWEDV